MNKLIITSAFIFFNSSMAFSQTRSVSRDFNKDGVIDHVTISEDGGSSFSSKGANYTDGKTKKKYEFSTLYSFGSFFAICNAANVLGKSGREQLSKLLFGSKLASKIDPSLQWLIDASSNKSEVKPLELINFSTKYTPFWIEGNPIIPDDYCVLLANNKYLSLLKNVEGSPEYDGKIYKSDYFWITYNPHNHKEVSDDFRIIQIDSTNQILTTAHGVVLKKGNKYSWVFINDSKIFDANEKLRWPSIIEAQMLNDYVLVRQSITVTELVNLFIVNPNSGLVVRLSNELMGVNSVEEMAIDKLKETVELSGSEDKKYLLTLSKIKELFKGLTKP